MSDLIKREDVIFLITHQRNSLLETAEGVAPHHADVLRDMALWWGELSEAVKKLAARTTPPEALQKSAGMCMYCGHVFHAADTSEPEVARVYAETIAHDQVCPENPLVKARSEVLAALESMVKACDNCGGTGTAYVGDETEYGQAPGSSAHPCVLCSKARIAVAKAHLSIPSPLARIDLTSYINAASIGGADCPHVVVEKLQQAIDAKQQEKP